MFIRKSVTPADGIDIRSARCLPMVACTTMEIFDAAPDRGQESETVCQKNSQLRATSLPRLDPDSQCQIVLAPRPAETGHFLSFGVAAEFSRERPFAQAPYGCALSHPMHASLMLCRGTARQPSFSQ